MLQTLQAVGCERDSTVRQLSGQVGTGSCVSSAFNLSCLILRQINHITSYPVMLRHRTPGKSPKFLPKYMMIDFMRDPGIEPGSVPWQGTILPLNQPRGMHVC